MDEIKLQRKRCSDNCSKDMAEPEQSSQDRPHVGWTVWRGRREGMQTDTGFVVIYNKTPRGG